MSVHIPTLRKLRDQLSDLTMRNRSLRLARLPKSRAFDLAWLDRDDRGLSAGVLKQLLSGRNTSVKLVDVGGDDAHADGLHRGLTYLDREVRLVEQERGVYDLSVGIGFLCGNIAEGKYLQAPLLLVPRRLKLERRAHDGARWSLAPNGDADTVDVNRTLLLALQRYANVSIDPDEIEEEAAALLFGRTREGSWLEPLAVELGDLLRRKGLSVRSTTSVWDAGPGVDASRVPPLPVYKAEEMPAQPVRKFELRPHAVLSRFPLADTALLDDYDRFIKSLEVEPHQPLGYGGALLNDARALRVVADAGLRPVVPSSRMHIEPTDESQEAVLSRAVAGQSLAVHGPPGTGKSQLIANLVATAAAEGKRVLIVSQKRAALDVVSQRLGPDLARFVAVVHDPARDRQALCNHIVGAVEALRDETHVEEEAGRRRALQEVGDAEKWFAAAQSAMGCTGPDGRTAAEVYASRMRNGAQPSVALMRSLPPLSPEVLAAELPMVEPYLALQASSRPEGSWQANRPDWSNYSADDLDSFLGDTLPALASAVSAAATWLRSAPAGTPDLATAAADHEAWVALGAWCQSALALSDAEWHLLRREAAVAVSPIAVPPPDRWEPTSATQLAALEYAAFVGDDWAVLGDWTSGACSLPANSWPWVRCLAALPAGVAPVQLVNAEVAELRRILDARDAAAGLVADLTTAVEVDAALTDYETESLAWYRYFAPSWYRARRAAGVAVGRADAKEADLAQAIPAWRSARDYAQLLADAAQCLPVLLSQGIKPAIVSRGDLGRTHSLAAGAAAVVEAYRALSRVNRVCPETIPTDAASAATLLAKARIGLQAQAILAGLQSSVDFVASAWRYLPVVSRALAGGTLPSAGVTRQVGGRVKHARRAKEVAEQLRDATVQVGKWFGPSLDTKVGEAVRADGGEALVAWLESEISPIFRASGDADRQCRGFERRVPGLAKVARTLAGAANISATIEVAYAERAVRDLETAVPLLRELTQTEAATRRARLAEAWHRLPSLNRRMLRARLALRAAAPEVDGSALSQRASQRRHRWPLRKLVEHFWASTLSRVFPIWLCSPETVATVFPFRSGMFDLVIFDEASQMTVARGLTSAMRGKVCVVAGDEQQLPPSNFFSASLEEDEEGTDEVVEEESLLGRAKVAGAQKGLLWHYRSRFPELIQYSNHRFYNKALRVAPVPATHAESAPVEWLGVQGAWDRASGTNEAEASAAVELLARYLAQHPNLSIGVITLNRQQSDRIEDLVAERTVKDERFGQLWATAMQRGFDERPFIRNLENVQGDERDVTVLSVGYSANAEGRVPLRFGALTVAGGERRLNVAVSRAREKMVVLCSFEPETQMDVVDSKSEGAHALREFLLFAQRGGKHIEAGGGGTHPHPAHAAVAELVRQALAGRGWTAEIGLGTSVARVDIAIRSRRESSQFVMALLLDSPASAWAETDIGREIGRVDYLARYGWCVRVLPLRSWAQAPQPMLEALLLELEVADQSLDPRRLPPSVGKLPPVRTGLGSRQPEAARGARQVPPPSPPPVGSRPSGARPSPPAVPVRPAPALAAPAPGTVQPGSTVRYRNTETSAVKEVILTGPTVARGVDALTLDRPLAQALLDANVGDIVQLDLQSRSVGLEILEVKPPPMGI